jgi:DNA-binding HxlR family transcriptional regulator
MLTASLEAVMPMPSSPMGCPMDSLLRLLMGPWTTYILWSLRQNGAMRFGAIRRTVQGVSAKVLTERLRMLEQAGVIYREYRPRIPPEVVYGLTQRGRELGPILDSLDALAQRWGGEDALGAAGNKTRAPEPVPVPAPAKPTPVASPARSTVVTHASGKRRSARAAAG